MSRRKQSNPKPLKREDEEWGNESEAMKGEPRTPSSGGSRAASSGGASPASGGSPTPSPPRLRLNPSLATDPALAPSAVRLKREAPTPSPPPATTPAPVTTPQPRDYLAVAAAAFPGLFPAAAPSYVCKPCGIRYSSLSTLQAHQEHYCSNRLPKPPATDSPGDANADESSGDSKTPRPPSKQYACAQCSYSADKKVSLNRHMRMHSSSPVGTAAVPASAPPANGDTDGPPAQDRYCADCDIRFSSIKTYRAHKTHYCSTRQVVKNPASARSGGSVTSGSAPPSPGPTPPAPRAEYALALPTNPILILPVGLLRNASTLPGATLPDPDAPCFLLPNGTFQPLSHAMSGMEGDGRSTAAAVLRSVNRARDGATPLDLSLRRSPESAAADDHEKENRLRSTTPEQIVCAPSLPPSPGSPAPIAVGSPRRSCSPTAESEPKRRRRSRGATPKPPSAPSPPEEKYAPAMPPGLLPPALALRLAAELPAAASPSVVVKQGVSKCKECNIVFCKYENYRVHKRLYCSAGGGDERASPAPEPGPPPQYRQLICLACGIHFSSLDNLQTHMSYYCTKRETRSPRGAGGGGEARGAGAGEGGWKCPCCEVVSPTAAAAQRHMEAHAGVKAFRCTICRYRGNTLRGMRTHIRMHFNNKKPADLQEESYIACVLEDDSREATSPSPGGGERVHRCSSCAYSSTYRGNVIRHARLVHATDEPEEDHASPPTLPTLPVSITPTVDIKKEDIKKEPGTETEETPNYCKSCDISFKYVNTFKAHKQFYCTANNQEAAANNNVPAPPRVSDTPVL